ncbi:MAG: flagellar basal-body rod protein FlgF [Bdellovibrionota bacterium]|nr:MAG: flagellar basal-body rod protein FlgF [Pseudomonadota bacterium]
MAMASSLLKTSVYNTKSVSHAMLNNIYVPVAGALAQERALETIANNLANVNTVGFKADSVAFTLLEPEPHKNYPSAIPPANYKEDMKDVYPLRGNEMASVGIAEMERDFSQGPAMNTHNKYDVMLEGEGFLAVQTSEGARYTRAGNLSLSNDGILISKNGDPILGEKGLISVRSTDFEINQQGEIFQDGQLVDKLKLVTFDNPKELEKVGNNNYFFGGDETTIKSADGLRVQQGFLEGSNVNAIKSMTSMIVAHRSYEAYQKAVANYDKMMEKSSNTIGQV